MSGSNAGNGSVGALTPVPPGPTTSSGTPQKRGGGTSGGTGSGNPPPTPPPPNKGGAGDAGAGGPAGPAGGPKGAKNATRDPSSWLNWYKHNNARIENLKRSLYTRVTSQNPLFQIGGNDTVNRSDAGHAMDALVRTDLMDTLMWAMRRNQDGRSNVRPAAFIAAGKLASSPTHVEQILSGLGRKESQLIKQCAVLGLGNLRRSSKHRQLSVTELARVRETLFRVVRSPREYDANTRSLAVMGIGLLGDQPFVETRGSVNN